MSSTGAWRMNIDRRLKPFNFAVAWQRTLLSAKSIFNQIMRVFLSFRSWGQIVYTFIPWIKEAKKKRRRPEGGLDRLSAKLTQARPKRRNPPILSRGNRESEKTREEDALLCSLSKRESHWKCAPRRKCVWHKKMGDPSSSSYCIDGFKSLVRSAINASRIAATLNNKEIHISQTFNLKNRCL